jgi:uncharacterized membrane protein YgcG
MMQIKRIFQHLMFPHRRLLRHFPDTVMDRIEAAVAASERVHHAEIRFAVEGALNLLPLWRGVSARQRALSLFASLGVWDTEANNGVLIYLLLADRDVEIVADRGFNGRVDAAQWASICHEMEASFAGGAFEAGILLGIERIDRLLSQHFPVRDNAENVNELTNRPVRI